MPATTAVLGPPATSTSTSTVLRRAVAAEWTRLWTVRSTWWALLAATAMMLLLGLAFGQDVDGAVPLWVPAEIAVSVTQFALYVLVMLPVTAEHATGAIRTTLQGVPRRGVLLLARTLVVVPVATAAAVVLSLGAMATAWIGLGADAEVVAGDVAGSIAAIAVVVASGSLLTVGLGAFLRSSAGTLTSVFMLLLVLPQLLTGFGVGWLDAIGERLPGFAALSLLTAFGIELPGTTATVVLGTWVVGALAGGAWSLVRRDAA